ncbi:MAG TPA: SHOCT domain-containing protein [Pirellulales bacterium]|nr:SHOCT domain-containing protein [Pirellulales bacterium]
MRIPTDGAGRSLRANGAANVVATRRLPLKLDQVHEVTSPVPAPVPDGKEDPVQKLRQLKEMLDGGLISADEFAAKKADILAKM